MSFIENIQWAFSSWESDEIAKDVHYINISTPVHYGVYVKFSGTSCEKFGVCSQTATSWLPPCLHTVSQYNRFENFSGNRKQWTRLSLGFIRHISEARLGQFCKRLHCTAIWCLAPIAIIHDELRHEWNYIVHSFEYWKNTLNKFNIKKLSESRIPVWNGQEFRQKH